MNDVIKAVCQVMPDAQVKHTRQDMLTALSFEVDSTRLEMLGHLPSFTIGAGIREIVQRLGPLGTLALVETDFLTDFE